MTKIKLICFPYAGGSSFIYKQLKELVSNHIEVVAVEYPGRGTRFSENTLTSINELVDDALNWFYDRQPVNYALLGYSMGSIVAYELYYNLLKHNFNPPQHLFFAASEPPGHKQKKMGIAKMNDLEFIRFIKDMNGTPKEVFDHQELLDIVLPVLRADFLAVEEYQCLPYTLPICSDVTVFAGENDRIPRENMLLWDRYVQNRCQFHFFNGDHFFIRNFTLEMAHIINKSLEINNILSKA